MANDEQTKLIPSVWRDPAGEPVSCLEKVKVLNENLEEIQQMCQDALEDAVPVIGEILSWQYRCHLRSEDNDAYQAAIDLTA